MGDPRQLKNKYERPKRLWESKRIAEEKAIKREYGLKTMKEIWVMNQELKRVRRAARRLLSLTEEERERDLPKLMGKLAKLGILEENAKLEQVLSLTVRDILERRLQTRVQRKGLAKTTKQARQLITHGFVSVGGRKIRSPSYLVQIAEDDSISYYKKFELEQPEPEEEAAAEAKEPEKKEEGAAE
ncbi:30S ribosomal protein S4 [Candidatus Micrarchaeota archaeon]|nr:30S ribosomal protein S4 [Candidatus Micrarchaeota archaeon]